MQRSSENRVSKLENGFVFGRWRAEPHYNTLSGPRKNGVQPSPIRISPKAMQVLVQLAARPGEFVSKDELLNSVWAQRVVTEDVLTGAIRVLRRATNDDPTRPALIETRKGSGYRLIVDVRDDIGGATPKPGRVWRWALAAMLLVAVAIPVGRTLFPAQAISRTVAVLPFANISGDERGKYFANAMTDALIYELAQHEGIDVISRTSAFSFGDPQPAIPSIAKQLGASFFVEGSVLANDNELRIVAQLIDARDLHVWSAQYDRQLEDIFDLQTDVSGQIASKIVGVVGDAPTRVEPTLAGDDLESLLRARYLLAQDDSESVAVAHEIFGSLGERHPDLAAAHLGRAQTNLVLFKQFQVSIEGLDEAYDAANKALALDPSQSAAYRALGQIVFFRDWDFEKAESYYLRAIERNESDTVAIRRYAWLLVALQRFDQAQLQIERVQLLDPFYYASADGAQLLMSAGQPEKAVVELERLNASVPGSAKILNSLAIAYWAVGRRDESAKALIAGRNALANSDEEQTDLASIYASDGRDGVYRYLLATGAYRGPVKQAALHAQLGDYESALDLLDQALAERDPSVLYLPARPEFQPIHDDPRYQAVIAGIRR